MFEEGEGGRESQPNMKETENLQPSFVSFSFPKLQQVGYSVQHDGRWEVKKSSVANKLRMSTVEERGPQFSAVTILPSQVQAKKRRLSGDGKSESIVGVSKKLRVGGQSDYIH